MALDRPNNEDFTQFAAAPVEQVIWGKALKILIFMLLIPVALILAVCPKQRHWQQTQPRNQ